MAKLPLCRVLALRLAVPIGSTPAATALSEHFLLSEPPKELMRLARPFLGGGLESPPPLAAFFDEARFVSEPRFCSMACIILAASWRSLPSRAIGALETQSIVRETEPPAESGTCAKCDHAGLLSRHGAQPRGGWARLMGL